MHHWDLIVLNSGSQTGHDLHSTSPEDILQCLDEFWVVKTVGFYWIKTRDAVKHPTMSYNNNNKIIWSKMLSSGEVENQWSRMT